MVLAEKVVPAHQRDWTLPVLNKVGVYLSCTCQRRHNGTDSRSGRLHS